MNASVTSGRVRVGTSHGRGAMSWVPISRYRPYLFVLPTAIPPSGLAHAPIESESGGSPVAWDSRASWSKSTLCGGVYGSEGGGPWIERARLSSGTNTASAALSMA